MQRVRLLLSNVSKAATKTNSKCHSKIIESIVLWHDSACSHVAPRVQDQLIAMWWEVLKHLAHIPDLLPRNYHVFEPLQKALERRTFTSDNDVLQAVVKWFRQQPKTKFCKRDMLMCASVRLLCNVCGDCNSWSTSPISILKWVSVIPASYFK
jgi:hypothetical protein